MHFDFVTWGIWIVSFGIWITMAINTFREIILLVRRQQKKLNQKDK